MASVEDEPIIQHQDACGRVCGKRGLFDGETLIASAPDSDYFGDQARAATAADLGLSEGDLEVLLLCKNHPDRSAVDCTICVPIDAED